MSRREPERVAGPPVWMRGEEEDGDEEERLRVREAEGEETTSDPATWRGAGRETSPLMSRSPPKESGP